MCKMYLRPEAETIKADIKKLALPSQQKEQMPVVCAWCGRELGFREGQGITHGICRPCQSSLVEETLKNQLRKEPKKWQN